jgi:hypothetical protein
MFLASSYWRGSINIGQMRSFPTEKEAIDYVRGLSDCQTVAQFAPYLARVYEIFPDKPPRLVKIPS